MDQTQASRWRKLLPMSRSVYTKAYEDRQYFPCCLLDSGLFHGMPESFLWIRSKYSGRKSNILLINAIILVWFDGYAEIFVFNGCHAIYGKMLPGLSLKRNTTSSQIINTLTRSHSYWFFKLIEGVQTAKSGQWDRQQQKNRNCMVLAWEC